MPIAYHQRTHNNGALRAADVGRAVLLTGWVAVRRDLGGMVFVDLRDRYGITQLKFNPETDPAAHETARTLRSEDCIAVRGNVVARGAAQINPKLPTGEIEVEVHEVDVLSRSETPPFEIVDDCKTNEDLRMRYRVLDLRRAPLQQKIILRHRITKTIRDYFDRHGFLDIETPMLTKSTPEGARDYLVPSRLQHGSFFALPQSPQLFKQLLMMAGFDRYMQIARCFRDEDLRKDRQPEFTQVDVEMAFAQPDTVLTLVEGCMAELWKQVLGVDIPLPLPRMTYDQALRDYGIDRPDLRFDMRIRDVSVLAARTEFNVFREAVARGGVVRCIVLPGGADLSDSQLKALTEEVRGIGAGGLPFTKVEADGGRVRLNKGVAKFFQGAQSGSAASLVTELCDATGAAPGDCIFFAAGPEANVCKWLAWLRTELAERRGLIAPNQWKFLWVVDFPLFGWNEEAKALYSMHHPFTSPRDEDLPLLGLPALGLPGLGAPALGLPPAAGAAACAATSTPGTTSTSGATSAPDLGGAPSDFPPLLGGGQGGLPDTRERSLSAGSPHPGIADVLRVRAKAYDLVVNGTELGGGSIRIHRADVQARVFQLLGISEEEARVKFQFLMEALRFGPPPHGGIALGLDRIVMLMTGAASLRDVIAFPKNAEAVCPLTGAPTPVSAAQLRELGLSFTQGS